MRELDKVNKIFQYAREEAVKTGWMTITVEHFFLGMIRQEDNEACRFLTGCGLSLPRIKSLILDRIDTGCAVPYNSIGLIRPGEELQHLSGEAASIIRSSPESIPDTLVFLNVIITEDNTITASIISEQGLDSPMLFNRAKAADGMPEDMEEGAFGDPEEMQESPEETLERYGYDLTGAAADGLLDPVTGRDREIERTAAILSRRKKNSPMIVGGPGVGKTAIVEGLAARIASGDVPLDLRNKRIISIDISSVVAGTRFRGDFEERMRKILQAAEEDPDTILFIDEIHTVAGAGGSGGALDAAAIMKPFLSNGSIQCIGATTSDEYRKIIEKDGALARRFQKVTVSPPSEEMTVSILEGLRKKYEEFHNVTYTAGALQACVSLSVRYITDRSLPDKAIDVMDEAGAAVHIKSSMPHESMISAGNRLKEIRMSKRASLEERDFETGARLLRMEREQEQDLHQAAGRQMHAASRKRPCVNVDDVLSAVSTMTGIPTGRIRVSGKSRIRSLRNALMHRVIGQDEAVDLTVRAIARNMAGLRDPGRPVGSFLFLGPTGVGKTHLAKLLAEQLFDSPDAVIRLDMSEYMEKISVSRLIGAPPGYVGYDEGGQLSERVRQKPYSVVLLDEIEKAHKDIFNILLQILDEGRLTDSNGHLVDFRNTVIILTSNIGSREIKDFGRGIGYSPAASDSTSYQKHQIDKALNKAFTPEFLNRLDETVYFRSLSKEDMKQILEIELTELYRRTAEAGYSLRLTSRAKEFLCNAGYDPAYGARPLKRALRRYLEDTVAEAVLSGLRHGSVITVDINPDRTGLTASGCHRREVQPVSQ